MSDILPQTEFVLSQALWRYTHGLIVLMIYEEIMIAGILIAFSSEDEIV